MNSRFTLDGSEQLERSVFALCQKTADAIRSIVPSSRLDLILLGGGYGRGEGGVLRTTAGEQPYNDLEFYAFVRGNDLLNRRRYALDFHHACEQLSQEAGLEIECKLLSLPKLRAAGPSMFYYDLISGHQCFHGDAALLACCDHHLAAHRIPMHEATRLLMNRCSGLLFALERFTGSAFTAEDADFVGRNIAKASLALGDVLLAARGQYHWSCRERHKRLTKLTEDTSFPQIDTVVALHRSGVEFKLHPVRTCGTRDELVERHTGVSAVARELWLWLERRRLEQPFSSLEDYAFSEINKCPETNRLKNRLINFRTFGPSALIHTSYPRERLLNTLPLLLWTEWKGNTRSEALIERQLRCTPIGLKSVVAAYAKLWSQFN